MSDTCSTESEWTSIRLTPIKENEDGTNNYDEFKVRSVLDLNAAGYWKYVDGPDYNPPDIPELVPSYQVEGLDSSQQKATFTVPGNEAAVAAAKKKAAPWLAGDKKAHALIVQAVPASKLFVVANCKSAHDAWVALKHEYEPSSPLMGIFIAQKLMGFKCNVSDDPVHWRHVMVQLYQKLCEADPGRMPDTEFAMHLVTLMSESPSWRYCHDSLREKICDGYLTGQPVSSSTVLERLREEEVELRIAPCVLEIDALVNGCKTRDGHADAGPSNQDQRRNAKAQQRQGRRLAPYNSQQGSASTSGRRRST